MCTSFERFLESELMFEGDIWVILVFALILVFIMPGKVPYGDAFDEEVNRLCDEMRDLIYRMTRMNSQCQISSAELLKHQWLIGSEHANREHR